MNQFRDCSKYLDSWNSPGLAREVSLMARIIGKDRQGNINRATRCERLTDTLLGLLEHLMHGDFGLHDHCKKAYVQAFQRWTNLEGDVTLL